MGSNDGAEISEIVGLLMLSKLVHLFQDNSVRLYRDDGLRVLSNFPVPETGRLRKNIVKIFKDYGLSITSKTNLKIIDDVTNLDVTFDLQNNSYKPTENQITYQYIYTNTQTVPLQF